MFEQGSDLSKESDMCLRCEDGTNFHVHSVIIRMWSDVLDGVLSAPCEQMHERPAILCAQEGGIVKEGPIRCLDLVGDSATQWLSALCCMYPVTPRLQITWENVLGLFLLADKYNIKGIIGICEEFLRASTTVFSSSENDPSYVWTWLELSDRWALQAVCRKCIHHITETSYLPCKQLSLSPSSSFVLEASGTKSTSPICAAAALRANSVPINPEVDSRCESVSAGTLRLLVTSLLEAFNDVGQELQGLRVMLDQEGLEAKKVKYHKWNTQTFTYMVMTRHHLTAKKDGTCKWKRSKGQQQGQGHLLHHHHHHPHHHPCRSLKTPYQVAD